MTKPNPDEKLLVDLLNTTVNLGSINNNSQRLYVRKAKAAILSNFVSKDKVREAMEAPNGHIFGEECCPICDHLKILRSKLGIEE